MPSQPTPDDLQRRLENRNRALRAKDATIARLRDELQRERAGRDAADGSRIIWIFCAGRTGSTWLGRMLGELGGMWDEPAVGALFGEFFYERFPQRRGARFLMAARYRNAWLPGIRDLVLRGAAARWDGDGYLTIKEPHGAIGAPLLVDALPESRVVVLVRDPRDVIASAYDGGRTGNWGGARRPEWMRSDRRPEWVLLRARAYLWDIQAAVQAYEMSSSPRAIVRYEDLRADTLGELRRLRDELRLDVEDEPLASAAERYAWENVPDEEKGPGRIFRKASPGSWEEDLTPEQVRTVEREARPVLDAFYGDAPAPLTPSEPQPPAPRPRFLAEWVQLLLGVQPGADP
jgi:sulfotransferase family protein